MIVVERTATQHTRRMVSGEPDAPQYGNVLDTLPDFALLCEKYPDFIFCEPPSAVERTEGGFAAPEARVQRDRDQSGLKKGDAHNTHETRGNGYD